MKTSPFFGATGAALLTLTAFVFAPTTSVRAVPVPDLVYNVTINTSSLSLTPNAPFSLDFQLVQGSGNVLNTVTLSNFTFTGGTASSTPDYTSGTQSGSFASSLVLTSPATPSGNVSEYAATFSAGVTSISFNVDQTRNSELVGSGTPIPDQFNVAVFDANFNNLTTTDPTGANTLLISAISNSETTANVNYYTLNAASVPEPGSVLLSLSALTGLAVLGMRRRFAF